MASIYSQPANTGAGIHSRTQLVTALSALRSERNPVTLDDFAIRHGIEQLLQDKELRETLKQHERVIYNEKNDTWAWKPDFDVRTPQDLLDLVKARYESAYPPGPHGFKLADLRESYPATREAVEAFAKARKRSARGLDTYGEQTQMTSKDGEGGAGATTNDTGPPPEETKKILILPGPKEGSIRQVYFNEASSAAFIAKNENKLVEPVDDEFRSLWHSLSVPDAVDLPRQLEQEGHMTATVVADDTAAQAAAAAAARARGRGRGRGRGMGRRVRIQNTHLDGVDLSSDYQGQG